MLKQYRALDLTDSRFWIMDHSEIGSCVHFGRPFSLSMTPAQMRSPSPCLGEHTEYMCREVLKMSDTEFIESLNDGVFE